MKLAMWVTAAALTLFSGLHVFVAYEHMRHVGPGRESVVAPMLTALLAAGLALWAVRQASRSRPAA